MCGEIAMMKTTGQKSDDVNGDEEIDDEDEDRCHKGIGQVIT